MSTAIKIQPADRIASLTPYPTPCRDSPGMLLLDNNEGAPITQSMHSVLNGLTVENLTRYPDVRTIENRIAERFGCSQSSVVVTNGADDAIDRVCRALLNPGEFMLTHTPGFVMISRYAKLAGADPQSIHWLDGKFPFDEFTNSICKDTKLISLVSPNNPTGQTIHAQDIRDLASRARSVGAVVMLDQAYIEYADYDPIDLLIGIPNLIFIRTMSKAMGLAGLRVGYAIGPTDLIQLLKTAGGPYPVSCISAAIAESVFMSTRDRETVIRQTITNRDALVSTLTSRGYRVLPTQANFVLVQFPHAVRMYEELVARGVLTRRYEAGSVLHSYLRITIPFQIEQLNQLITAISEIGVNQ